MQLSFFVVIVVVLCCKMFINANEIFHIFVIFTSASGMTQKPISPNDSFISRLSAPVTISGYKLGISLSSIKSSGLSFNKTFLEDNVFW